MSRRAGVDERTRHLDRIREVRAGDTPAKVGYPIGIRECRVLRVAAVSPGMLRLTLGGDGVAGFESHAPDEHVKIVFPEPDTAELRLPVPDGTMLSWPRPMPPTREYTVRRFDAAAGEIDVDVVLHPGGLASDWTGTARPGDPVHVAGPPGGLVVPDRFDRYLLVGDLTALPAIARWLEEMAPSTTGRAVVVAADPRDEIDLRRPPGMRLDWIRPSDADVLGRAVRALEVVAGGSLYVWAAGEAELLKPVRRWVRDVLGLPPHQYSITGYWRRGTSGFDEDHNAP